MWKCLTVVRIEGLEAGRSGEHEDVSAGGILRSVYCDCMFRVVLRPNTEPVDTESMERQKRRENDELSSNIQKFLRSERIQWTKTKYRTSALCESTTLITWHDDKGSLWFMATRQVLRMLGLSAAEMPHILHIFLQSSAERLQVSPTHIILQSDWSKNSS